MGRVLGTATPGLAIAFVIELTKLRSLCTVKLREKKGLVRDCVLTLQMSSDQVEAIHSFRRHHRLTSRSSA